MANKIEDLVSYFIVGEKMKDEQLSEFTERWTEPQVNKEIAKVEERYTSLTNTPIAEYMGIQIFSETIKKFKTFSDREGHQRVVRAAQRRVLYYHHIQYERNKNDREGTTSTNS